MEQPEFIVSIFGPEVAKATPDSVLHPCSGCGRSLWISGDSITLVEQGVPLFCPACAPPLTHPPIMTEAQRLEIERALGYPYSWDAYRRDVARLLMSLRRDPTVERSPQP